MALTLPAVCCVLVLGLVQATFAAPEKMTIDGRRNPELLPEYLVWRSGFRHLALFSSALDHVFVTEMRLTPADALLVFDEAKAQSERDRVCEVHQDDVVQRTSNDTPAVMLEAIQRVILACRWDVLHAQQRLLQALSPAAQTALVGWMNAYRSTMTVHVLKHDFEFFRKPR